jgi:hypothetical protein
MEAGSKNRAQVSGCTVQGSRVQGAGCKAQGTIKMEPPLLHRRTGDGSRVETRDGRWKRGDGRVKT